MRVIVDTLDFAVPDVTIEFLLHFLGLDKVNFEEGKTMRTNYKKSLYLKGICIGYDNPYGKYSCYVNMSGRGCRMFEDLKDKNLDWLTLLKSLVDLKADFRRIDIAVDDYTDLIHPLKLIDYYKKGKYAGSLRKCFGYVFDKEEFQAGPPGAHFLVRVYNKALEKGYKDGLCDGKPWIRCEMQLRDKKATQFIAEWISSEDLNKIYCGHLLEGVRFLTKPNNKENSQRIPVAPFWKKFCDDALRIPFVSEPGTAYNLSKLERFIMQQVGSSIRTYLCIYDFTPEQLYRKFSDSKIKMNKNQLALLKASAEAEVKAREKRAALNPQRFLTDEEFKKFQDRDFVDEFSELPYVLDKPATKEEIEDDIINAIIGSDVYQEPQQMRFDDVK